MEKIVRERLDSIINEGKITRSYDTPLTREEIRSLIGKILIKFNKEGGRNIPNMLNWLKINNFGDYQFNFWLKAIIDTLFKRTAGVWLPINQNLSIDQLTDKAMGYWKTKSKKNTDDIK